MAKTRGTKSQIACRVTDAAGYARPYYRRFGSMPSTVQTPDWRGCAIGGCRDFVHWLLNGLQSCRNEVLSFLEMLS